MLSIDSQNRAGIDLSIQQGDRVKIESFKISGAEKLSEASLLKLFKIGEADMLFMNYFTNKRLIYGGRIQARNRLND
jgi:outer membrane protein assembly factor BamA